MPRLSVEHSAEEFLYEQGLIDRRTVQRRALLGCVGCRWLQAEKQGKETKFYGLEIVRCTLIKSGVVYRMLNQLADMGLMVREQEDVSTSAEGRPPRIYYYPADSELGNGFWDSLKVPTECALELDNQDDE